MKKAMVLVVLLLSVLAVAWGEDADLPDPEALGPYPVGVTTTVFVDGSRQDAYVGGCRTLLTEVWYPAADAAAKEPPGRLLDYYLGATDPNVPILVKAAFGADIIARDATFKELAVRDASVRAGTFPLVIFSHGNGGMRSQNIFWCEHLASHGYVVVAPDHSGNCLMTMLDGKLWMYNEEGREQSAKDRPADVRFLIDAMQRWNKGGDSRFRGKLDLDRIAVAGHSFGGYTATLVADVDERVDAIIPMAGVAREWQAHDTPLLMFVAGEDDTIGLEGVARMRKYYEEATGPKHMVEFPDAGHYSFTEMYRLNPEFGDGVGHGKRITDQQPVDYVSMEQVYPLVNGYSIAFLGVHLKGQDGYTAYLAENHAQDRMKYEHAATGQ